MASKSNFLCVFAFKLLLFVFLRAVGRAESYSDWWTFTRERRKFLQMQLCKIESMLSLRSVCSHVIAELVESWMPRIFRFSNNRFAIFQTGDSLTEANFKALSGSISDRMVSLVGMDLCCIEDILRPLQLILDKHPWRKISNVIVLSRLGHSSRNSFLISLSSHPSKPFARNFNVYETPMFVNAV